MDPEIRACVERFADLINEARNMQDQDCIPADVECVMHLDKDEDDDNKPECYYYLVHPKKRLLFWLNEFNAGTYMIDLEGVKEPTHLSKTPTRPSKN